MVITKDTALNSIDFGDVDDGLFITKDVVLNPDKMFFILSHFKGQKISILSGYNRFQLYSSHECLYDEVEVKQLAEVVNYAKTDFNIQMDFDDEYSVQEAIIASRKINGIVDRINSANVNGQPLSPLEKFLMAYMYVTNRVYNADTSTDNSSKSRNLVSVLSGDKIVCVGFANMLTTILNRVGIPCTIQDLFSENADKKQFINHAACCVRLEDSKYNLHGIYYSDPTTDCLFKGKNAPENPTLNFALIPYSKIDLKYNKHMFLNKLAVEEMLDNNPEYLKYAKDVPKILSYLFPEITHGKAQNEILREKAIKEIYKSDVFKNIDSYIDSLTLKKAKKEYDSFVSMFFNPLSVPGLAKSGKLANTIFNMINTLARMNVSKEEILELVDKNFSPKNISDVFIKKYVTTFKLDEDSAKKMAKDDILIVEKSIPKIKELIESFKFDKVKLRDKDSIIEDDSTLIAHSFLRESIFSDTYPKEFRPDFSGIYVLLKRGIPLDEIKYLLKERISAMDFVSIYFDTCPNFDNKEYSLNERELYACDNFHNHERIYNQPYLKKFNALVDSAKELSLAHYVQPLIAVFQSQGYSEDDAIKKASQITRNSALTLNLMA